MIGAWSQLTGLHVFQRCWKHQAFIQLYLDNVWEHDIVVWYILRIYGSPGYWHHLPGYYINYMYIWFYICHMSEGNFLLMGKTSFNADGRDEWVKPRGSFGTSPSSTASSGKNWQKACDQPILRWVQDAAPTFSTEFDWICLWSLRTQLASLRFLVSVSTRASGVIKRLTTGGMIWSQQSPTSLTQRQAVFLVARCGYQTFFWGATRRFSNSTLVHRSLCIQHLIYIMSTKSSYISSR